jgi:GNAT superfamily N-acetyltransferase
MRLQLVVPSVEYQRDATFFVHAGCILAACINLSIADSFVLQDHLFISHLTIMNVAPVVPVRSLELRLLDNQETVWEMLMHAAHETSDLRASPLLAPCGADFGMLPGDLGVVALVQEVDDRKPVGAAWLRLLKYTGFGYVSDDIPKLAIAMLPNYQCPGIGTKLLLQLLADARQTGNNYYRGASV